MSKRKSIRKKLRKQNLIEHERGKNASLFALNDIGRDFSNRSRKKSDKENLKRARCIWTIKIARRTEKPHHIDSALATRVFAKETGARKLRMEILLDKRAVRQIRLSAQDAVEEGDIETLREDILEAFTEGTGRRDRASAR